MPLRRYIFNTLTVVSLLLMLATVGLWGVSTKYADQYSWFITKHHFLRVENDGGAIEVHSFNAKASWASWFDASQVQHGYRRSGGVEWLGMWKWFSFFRRCDSTGEVLSIDLPHWFLTLIFAIIPTIWLYKWNKRRKLGPNACPSCGYDLTGNESGACPECGAESKAEV